MRVYYIFNKARPWIPFSLIIGAIDINAIVIGPDDGIATKRFSIYDQEIETISYDSDQLYYQVHCSDRIINIKTIKFEIVEKDECQESDIIALIF
jgi:hypothetical protein